MVQHVAAAGHSARFDRAVGERSHLHGDLEDDIPVRKPRMGNQNQDSSVD